MTLPPVNEVKYNKTKRGYFGELGKGANARIRFLQSAVTKDELDDITLIENIPGSEKWAIQDLFQRDVDMTRVEQSILPYLQDRSKVKFFNPLTLVLLPINEATGQVDAEIPYMPPVTINESGHEYTLYERDGLLNYKVHTKFPAYSEVHWNDRRVKLVAIDGQHRLSALKYWKQAPGPKDLDEWQIPVVILSVFRADSNPSHAPANLLEIVRKTFVYINSRAEEVNEARRILLDDEEVNAVCTQELVQASHKNDCLTEAEVDTNKLPLLFFDWRGQVKWRKDAAESGPVTATGSVLSIVEIHEWFKEYIFDENEKIVLELNDLDPPLSEGYSDTNVLTHSDAERVRKQFLKVVYPGVSGLLQGFAPYKAYVKQLRAFEKKQVTESDAARFVFQKLRFGSHPEVLGQMKSLVDTAYASIVGQLQKMRTDCFDELINRDIGMRAVIYAFAALKDTRDDFEKTTTTWKQHADWFVPAMNEVYKGGWFRAYADLDKPQQKLLTHLCYDTTGSIINYKITDVRNALGSFVALLVVNQKLNEFAQPQQAQLWDTYGDPLFGPLRKGFRKEQKARLKDEFKGTQQEFIAEVNSTAETKTKQRIAAIRKQLLKLAD